MCLMLYWSLLDIFYGTLSSRKDHVTSPKGQSRAFREMMSSSYLSNSISISTTEQLLQYVVFGNLFLLCISHVVGSQFISLPPSPLLFQLMTFALPDPIKDHNWPFVWRLSSLL